MAVMQCGGDGRNTWHGDWVGCRLLGWGVFGSALRSLNEVFGR